MAIKMKSIQKLLSLSLIGVSSFLSFLANSQFTYAKDTSDLYSINARTPVLIAVIDTGIDFTHSHLAASKGKDGWNFVTNKPNPSDENGHGTHVTGIIQEVIKSVPAHLTGLPQIKFMALKYYTPGSSGADNLARSIQALYYAIEHGATLINYSGGGPGFSKAELAALKLAEERGILVIAAAGNERQDSDSPENFYYPSAYQMYGLTNILTVAALTQADTLLESSNWGVKNVTVAARGEKIVNSVPHQQYKAMSGTSQATAFVTGIAAVLKASDRTLTPQRIKELIAQTSEPLPALKGKVASGGRVNLYRAILEMKKDPKVSLSPLLTETGAPAQPVLVQE